MEEGLEHSAGQTYPGDPARLREDLGKYLGNLTEKRERALAVVAPHAGYVYSGAVAGAVYSEIEVPDRVILLGPNHTGIGQRFALMASNEWETPLGRVRVNVELAKGLLDACPLLSEDASAHKLEHSLEVQLPFLQVLNPGASIVPITLMHATFSECQTLGRAIAETIASTAASTDGDILMVVSSDMNHYESDSVTRAKDELAIERVLALDAEGLLKVTAEKEITMCGVVPTAVAIIAALELGATGARLVSHTTSGETSGDYDEVVGYAGMVIT